MDYELKEFGWSLEQILGLMQDWESEFKVRRFAEETAEAQAEG